jgi:hypothetical protein
MSARTTGAIALQPTGNAQGGFYFYSLATGRILNRNPWMKLPMPNNIIARVGFMAQNGQNSPPVTARENKTGYPVPPNSHEESDPDKDLIREPELDDNGSETATGTIPMTNVMTEDDYSVDKKRQNN